MGRGLAAILAPGTGGADSDLREVPIDLVRPNPEQPRQSFGGEALLGLADSIRERGILQPLVVRPLLGGRYELVAGERRLRAAEIAGLSAVPAIVREVHDSDRLELALIENVAREDLNPVEEARACATLVDDLGITQEELGRKLGKSRVAITNLIRLLTLPEDTLSMIESGELSEGHGRALLACKEHSQRKSLAREARDKGWSVRETERRAKAAEATAPAPEQRPSPVAVHPDLADALAAAEDALSAALGREVSVRPSANGCRVEFELESATDGIDLAERLLRRAAA